MQSPTPNSQAIVSLTAPFSVNRHEAPSDRVGFDEPFLVELNQDIGETTNIAKEHPQVVERLLKLAETMREDLGDFDRIGTCSFSSCSTRVGQSCLFRRRASAKL